MQRETELKILRELLRQLDENVNIDSGVQLVNPTSSYTCPEQATREWNELFQGLPQFIGLAGDLPEPHSYFTTDNFGIPVLATRDGDGRFRAFLNACRHRGVRLAHDDRGVARRHTCVFHGWSYDPAGTLVGIPREHDFGEIDKSCRGLIELPSQERHGMLWVHPQPDATLDVEAVLGELDEEIAGWNLADFVYQGEKVISMDLNWKLANDTFGETYHFKHLHKNTLANILEGDALHYETFGQNHRFCFGTKSISELRDKPEDEWVFQGNVSFFYYLFPNVQLSPNRNGITLIKMYPDGENPGASTTHISFYYTPEVIEAAQQAQRSEPVNPYETDEDGNRPSSLQASIEVFTSTVEQEDYLMGETTQRAAESGLLGDVIFGRNEPALHHYHNTIREVFGQEPLAEL